MRTIKLICCDIEWVFNNATSDPQPGWTIQLKGRDKQDDKYVWLIATITHVQLSPYQQILTVWASPSCDCGMTYEYIKENIEPE